MEVVGINGSPRKAGNTAILIQTVFDELTKLGIETELIQLSNKQKGEEKCSQKTMRSL
ncbi:MAG: NAD(P)H-dependent oxidoreductase [Methanosarcina sp.]|jgi:multimeric flavodoxin WrbA